MSAASLSIINPVIGISFSRMNEAKRKMERAQEEARCEGESLSRAISGLQVSDGRLRMKAEALNSLRSRISRRQGGLQVMGAHIDYAVKRFQEVDDLCARRIKSSGYEYGRLMGLSTQHGIYGNIVRGLNPFVNQGKAAWDYVKANRDRILDCVQTGLDIIGLIPGLGDIADGINAGIYLLRGDYGSAALSLAAMIPIAGCAATAGKFIYKGVKAYKQGRKIAKAIDRAGEVFGIVKKAGNKGIQRITSKAVDVIANASQAFSKRPGLAAAGAGVFKGSIPDSVKAGISKMKETPVQKNFNAIYKDLGAGAGKAAEAAAKAVVDAKFTGTLLQGMPSFMDNMAPILDDVGMSASRFDQLRPVSADTLSSADRGLIKAVRDAIPMPTDKTIMQKVIPQGDIAKYLDGTYTKVGGYVAKAQDVKWLTGYDDIYNSLRLDYTGTAYKPAADECVGVIRYKTPETSKIEIPYSQAMGGDTVAGPPFTGNGFTAATNGQAIPEYECSDLVRLYDGAELYTVTKDGMETLAAVYDSTLGRFVDITIGG